MLDFLFGWGQVLCLAGYVYGAYLVVTHSDAFRSDEAKEDRRPALQIDRGEKRLWRRYLRSNW